MASTRDKLRRMPGPAVLLLCLLGILLIFAAVGPDSIYSIFHERSDFRHFYIGAKIVNSGDLYDVDHVLATQNKLFGATTRSEFPTRLPFYYVFLSPLAELPFNVGQWLWLAGMTMAIMASVWLNAGLGRTRMVIACCWSCPLVFSLPVGQDIALVLLILGAASWAVYARRNWWLAGLLFSLCLIKFNLILLCPLLIIGKAKWRLAAGFMAGSTSLLAISFLVAGWDWPGEYLAEVFDPLVSPGLASMPNIHGLMFNFQQPRALEYLLSFTVIGLVWWVVRNRSFGVAAAVTLMGSLLLSQHAYLTDCAILIPPLLTLTRPNNGRLVRYCALLLLLPVPYVITFFRQSGSGLAVLLLVLLLAIAFDSRSRRTLSVPRERISRWAGLLP